MKHINLKALGLGVLLCAFPASAGPPDGLITSQTKLSLWTTAGVKSTAVHVDTNDGVVTLFGKVPTAEQKALAEKTTREVGGVRDVHNLLQVVAEAQQKAVESSDKDLTALAEKRLKADPALKDSKISVKSVDKGVVLLSGDARTFSDHLRAVAIVDRIPGVKRVATEVKYPDAFGDEERIMFLSPHASNRVHYKAAEAKGSVSDLRISAAVKLNLLTASHVPSTEIDVDTDDGIVTLFGMVPTAAVKNVAGVEAGKVSGVVRVQNQLEVVPSAQKEAIEAKDEDIGKGLETAFHDRADFKGVHTEVKNGIVRLTGTVDSAWDEINAVRLARQVAGVRGVEDQLKLEDKSS